MYRDPTFVSGPEPSTYALVIVALLGLIVLRCRRMIFNPHTQKRMRIHAEEIQSPVPGELGLHVNKVSSAVELTHEPSGTTVHCSDSRSQHTNRALALLRLVEKMESQRTTAAKRSKCAAKSRSDAGRLLLPEPERHQEGAALHAEALVDRRDVFVRGRDGLSHRGGDFLFGHPGEEFVKNAARRRAERGVGDEQAGVEKKLAMEAADSPQQRGG